MNFLSRVAAAIVGLALAVWIARASSMSTVLVVLAVVAGAQVFLLRSPKLILLRSLPLLLFAAMLWLLRAFGGDRSPQLPLQVVFVYFAALLLGRLVMAGRIPVPTSRPLFRLYLFAHFIRHFTEILSTETRRVFIARQFAAPRLTGPGGFRSLIHVLEAVFLRAITRAEHFYAAQLLRGLDA